MPDLLRCASRLAVIGGAGCGKSTLLAYLAVTLAEAAQQDPPYRLPFGLPDSSRLPVPLLIPLRYYRNYLTWCDASPQECLRNPRARTLTGFIPWYLQRRNAILELSADFFHRLLQGGGCLLLLDGLDEVVDLRERGEVRQEVENLLNAVYPGTPCIVTAREAGYKHEAILGDDFTRLDVRPLEKPQIATLVRNWCIQLYPADVEGQTTAIVDEIEKVNALRLRKDLPPLVDTPLLTTMVISVKWDKAELPRERARLYAACVEVILQALYVLPEGARDTARQEMVEWGGPWDQQREWLAQLALAMHTGGADGAAVHKIRLQELLAQWMAPADLDKFITATRERGGLLDERNDFFQFLHLTFQEFLTAWLLTKQRKAGWQILEPHLTDPWWREVALLAYGCARMDYGPIARDYLEWLTTREGQARLPGLELAGAALLEVERPEPGVRQAIAEHLAAGMTDPQSLSPAVVRARAGRTLAALGDPRESVTTLAGMEFCYVPEGRFWMGDDRDDDAKPADWCNVLNERPYWLARFPVTVAQWREYVQRSNRQPRDADSRRGADNHPVVYVYWEEARDFAAWLDDYAHQQGRLVGEWHVGLPSEAEWEKAARGGEEIPAPEQRLISPLRDFVTAVAGLRPSHRQGEENLSFIVNPAPRREYPWAGDADPERANYEDTRIGTTSAVGCFPGGVSPYGCEDLAGNVWEWTRSLWGTDWQKPDFEYPYKKRLQERENLKAGKEWLRVIRGGSFWNDRYAVRCACRLRDYPGFLDIGRWGFRVGVSLRA